MRAVLAAVLMAISVAPAGQPDTLLIVGDSIVRGGYLADESTRWADRIGELVPYAVEVDGKGGSSATAYRNNGTRRWVTYWSTIVDQRPDVLVIGLGVNDLHLVEPRHICQVLVWFVTSAMERGIDARVLTILPTARGDDADRLEVNACLRATIPAGHLIDLGPAFGDVLAPELDIGDGIHPNEAGHRLIAEVVSASL